MTAWNLAPNPSIVVNPIMPRLRRCAGVKSVRSSLTAATSQWPPISHYWIPEQSVAVARQDANYLTDQEIRRVFYTE